MADYHLRSAHVSCLYYVYSLGSVTSAELCEHCEEDKATISRAVDYLETNGFLLRDTGAKRYKSPLLLTDKGRDAGKRIAEKIGGILETISHALTENERIEFYRCLSTISRSLEAIVQNSGRKGAVMQLKTRIIVDSTADLGPEIKERVYTVPLTVHFGQEEYIDGVTIDHKTFYEKLVESDVLPTTSPGNPERLHRRV